MPNVSTDDVLTPFQIEKLLATTINELREGVDDYGRAARNAAVAEADYKQAYHTKMVMIIATGEVPEVKVEGETKKPARRQNPEWHVKEIASRDDNVAKLYRAHLLAAAERDTIAEAQRSRREVIGALRTFAANARGQT